MVTTGIRIAGYVLLVAGLAIPEFRAPAWSGSNEPFPGFALFAPHQIGSHLSLGGWLLILWARIRRLEATNAKG